MAGGMHTGSRQAQKAAARSRTHWPTATNAGYVSGQTRQAKDSRHPKTAESVNDWRGVVGLHRRKSNNRSDRPSRSTGEP